MWIEESQARERKNKSETTRWETLYRAWLSREQNRPAGVPGSPNVGKRIKESLRAARTELYKSKNRGTQELSTKEFYRRYKLKQGVQWIEKLTVTPDWNDPEKKAGETAQQEEILKEATKYYEWLFETKETRPAEKYRMLNVLGRNALTNDEASKCEGDISGSEVFKVLRNLPRNKAPGPDLIPNEYYKTFGTLEAPVLAEVYNEAHQTGALPDSRSKTVR